jgi:hypothetical protein
MSTEALEAAPLDELNAIGRSLVRGVATKVDAKFFSAEAATAKSPAGILNSGTLPGASGAVNIERLVTGIGAVGAVI